MAVLSGRELEVLDLFDCSPQSLKTEIQRKNLKNKTVGVSLSSPLVFSMDHPIPANIPKAHWMNYVQNWVRQHQQWGAQELANWQIDFDEKLTIGVISQTEIQALEIWIKQAGLKPVLAEPVSMTDSRDCFLEIKKLEDKENFWRAISVAVGLKDWMAEKHD